LAGDDLAAAEPACRALFGTPHQPLHHGCGRQGNYQAVSFAHSGGPRQPGATSSYDVLSTPPDRRGFHGVLTAKTKVREIPKDPLVFQRAVDSAEKLSVLHLPLPSSTSPFSSDPDVLERDALEHDAALLNPTFAIRLGDGG